MTGPDVVDPRVTPEALHELWPEGTRWVHRGAGDRPADEDVHGDDDADAEACDGREGSLRIDGGGEHHPDEEEREHRLPEKPLPGGDAGRQRRCAEISVESVREHCLDEERRGDGAGELREPVRDRQRGLDPPGHEEAEGHDWVEMPA